MKILAVSDVVDKRVYNESAAQRFHDVDMVISCGDLPYYYVEFIIDSLNVPVFYVRGNHTHKVEYTGGMLKRTEPGGAINLHGKVINFKGLLLAGMEGSLRYRQGDNMYSQREAWVILIKMVPRLLFNRLRHGRFLDVFVTHAPPYQVQDREDLPHQGFKAFRWFLKTFKPTFHFHGHIHLYDRNEPWMTTFERTRVINVYGVREIQAETWNFF